jgi:hypothetical protein
MESLMNFHVCTIDDCWRDIDAHAERIKESLIKEHVSSDSTLPLEPALKALILKFIERHNFTVTAYSSPEFLLIDLTDGVYYPDYLIIDWDFGGSLPENETIETEIQKMLNLCPVKAVIFSAKFERDDIKGRLKELLPVEQLDRIKYCPKIDDQKQTERYAEEFITEISNYYNKPEYKLYKEIQQIFSFSTQKVFADIFRFGFDNYLACTMGTDDENNLEFIELMKNKISANIKKEFSMNNFLDFIAQHIVNEVSIQLPASIDLKNSKDSENKGNEPNIHGIWNHRLYSPAGEIVKTGMILKKKEGNHDELYMVMTRECDLACFFKGNIAQKTNGILLIIELEKSELPKKERIHSLTDFKDGAYWLLCIKINEDFYHYKCNPRRLCLLKLEKNKNEGDEDKTSPLTSEDIKNYEPICILNQPFLSNLIMSVFNYNMGYGVPNYTTALTDSLKKLT